MKIIIKITILSFFLVSQVFAHSGKPKYHLIIDTDGALDDMRALAMFLSGNDIRVLAITCSQGTLMPDSVYIKVQSLLSEFHHEGIPVGIGDETGQELPAWSTFAQGISWGKTLKSQTIRTHENANLILNRTTENYPEKITLIALGSLKTHADWIKSNPMITKKIDKIIWYNNPEIENGFNYKASPESYKYIKQSGVDFVVIGNNSGKYVIDESYLNSLKNINSQYAKQIIDVHKQPDIEKRIEQKHLQFWDDIVPLYLIVPMFFESETKDSTRFVSLNESMSGSLIYEIVGKLMESATTTNNRVFNEFPVDTTLYKPEYAKILKSTIDKFGLIEWKAISMTNEIHGHTGIYSIIGAKMGVRAMEFFNIGVNNLTVTTFAGHKPPLSCFNDGIQISTGATIGQGLITISDSLSVIPTAIFKFNNQKIRISLKPEIAAQMQKEIKYGIQEHGLLTAEYWIYIEELAIKYWDNYNRYEIFEIHEL